jgi:Na+-translocating ferredoxin:NAD+ oxidoreductase RnfA subunit
MKCVLKWAWLGWHFSKSTIRSRLYTIPITIKEHKVTSHSSAMATVHSLTLDLSRNITFHLIYGSTQHFVEMIIISTSPGVKTS